MPVKVKHHPVPDALEAFRKDESATVWLGRHMRDYHADFGTMYAINLLTQLTQNERKEFRRLPQAAQRGLAEGGRRNVAASIILRGCQGAGVPEPWTPGPSGYTGLEETLSEWAERDGCWKDYADSYCREQGYRTFGRLINGSEANIYYRESTGKCIKVIDITHYPDGIQGLMDKISIHNSLFPESQYHVEGFGVKDTADDHTGYSVIVTQNFIRGTHPTTQQIHDMMELKQLRRNAKTSSCITGDGTIEVDDLNFFNIIVTPKNNVCVIDCDARLSRNRAIPEPEFTEEGVRAIEAFMREIVPKPVIKGKPIPEKATVFTENGREYYQTPRGILAALSFSGLSDREKESLSRGEAIIRGQTVQRFNPALGRIITTEKVKLVKKPRLK